MAHNDSDMTPMEVVDFHLDLLARYQSSRGEYAVERFNAALESSWGGTPYDTILKMINYAQTFYVTAEMALLAGEMAVDLEGLPVFPRDLIHDPMLIVLDERAGVPLEFFSATQAATAGEEKFVSTPIKAVLLYHHHLIRTVRGDDASVSDGIGALFFVRTDGDLIYQFQQQLMKDNSGAPAITAEEWADGGADYYHSFPALLGDSTAWTYGTSWKVAPYWNEDEQRWNTEEEVFQERELDTVTPTAARMRTFLHSLLLMMQEEVYTERQPIPRAALKRMKRGSVLPPEDGCLSVTRLRRRVYPDAPEPDPEGRTWSHRWFVRPHWRILHRGTPEQKAVHVKGYIKGPEHAPLIIKSKLTRLES